MTWQGLSNIPPVLAMVLITAVFPSPPVISSLVSDVTVPRVSGPQHSPGSTQSLKYQNRDQTQNTDHKMDCGSIIFTISYFYPLP